MHELAIDECTCFIYSKCTIWRDLINLYRAVIVAGTFSGYKMHVLIGVAMTA